MTTPTPSPATKTSGPKTVQMHRTVHELHTGAKTEDAIDAGTLLTDDVVKEHKLDTKTLDALTDKGALELVDVLRD